MARQSSIRFRGASPGVPGCSAAGNLSRFHRIFTPGAHLRLSLHPPTQPEEVSEAPETAAAEAMHAARGLGDAARGCSTPTYSPASGGQAGEGGHG